MIQDKNLIALAEAAGISLSYIDAQGNEAETAEEAIRDVLGGLGYQASDQSQIKMSLERRDEELRRHGRGSLAVEAGRAPLISVKEYQTAAIDWVLTFEDGAVRDGRSEVELSGAGPQLRLPALPEGYHTLLLSQPGEDIRLSLLSAPRRAYIPGAFLDQQRGFGVAAQVYGLRTPHNLGIGDLNDVAKLAEGAGQCGASFLGLSPLHALFPGDRTKISPYAPSSRMFLDPVYIDPRSVPDFASSPVAQLLNQEGMARRIMALHALPLVDYAKAWALKREILDQLWLSFVQAEDDAFENFRVAGGEALLLHATFEALSEKFARGGVLSVNDWPSEFQSPQSEAVSRFQAGSPQLIGFHAWLQWLAALQLSNAQERGLASGMSIGLYRDLAVGANGEGGEVWGRPDRYLRDLFIGAPPDLLSPRGQNWGLLPFNPRSLANEGMAGFRELVSANMRNAGALRIDHAFQLQRLYLIPTSATPQHGAYVNFPLEEMLAVLRLESKRAKAMVIAEDLGTGPNGFSEKLMDMGILSSRIFAFERRGDGAFKSPESYPRNSLAAFATHDLPTFAGWWKGLDTDLRESMQLITAQEAAHERHDRQADHGRFRAALDQAGIRIENWGGDGMPPPEVPVRLLAKSPAMLVALQLEDILGDDNQANLPGTTSVHPNWRRKMKIDLDQTLRPDGPLVKAAAAMLEEGRNAEGVAPRLAIASPHATYRLQFHKDFTFADATRILPYLSSMGISHIYASPLLQARPGSTHGYDIIDPQAINSELGGESGFMDFATAAVDQGLKILLDIVPNHMGVGGAGNRWWLSVLEWGQRSSFSDTFDIDWDRLGANGKLVAPFLGDPYGVALEKGDLKLKFDREAGSFSVWHFEHQFPLCPLTYPDILDRAVLVDTEDGGHAINGLLTVSEELRALAHDTGQPAPEIVAICEKVKRKIALLARRVEAFDALEQATSVLNGTPGLPESFGALHRLLERQSFRLAFWRVASSDINYRRFFDIDGLAGVRIEEEAVFQRTHRLIFDLVRQGLIDGLRIDHIDGLADPESYARALQREAGPGLYVVAEKILATGEDLRDWPLAGTTGYDILNIIDGVFVDRANEGAFDQLYEAFAGPQPPYAAQLQAAKSQVLLESFSSELESLVSDMKRIADSNRLTRDYSVNAIRVALSDLIVAFPVYRTYLGTGPVPDADRALLEVVLRSAKRATKLPDRTIHEFICATLLGTTPSGRPGVASSLLVSRFRRRFQQLTGPVMAKSLEDTLFYRYFRFLALNEVGGEPDRFGIALDDFHAFNTMRANSWPRALTATATHDTKRGEDARARLLALSETPDLWREMIGIWRDETGNVSGPDMNDQYMLLQTIIGAWPLELLDRADETSLASFRERLAAYIPKAFREGKRHSKWIEPDEDYESAAIRLVARLLTAGSPFMSRVQAPMREIAQRGTTIALARTVLKCTLPGIPDFYQGTGLWDFSLVDPDNRRPVDYQSRAQLIKDTDPFPNLLSTWQDGRVKHQLIKILLDDRREHEPFYDKADYLPLAARGRSPERVLSFTRTYEAHMLLVTVLRLQGPRGNEGEVDSGAAHDDLAEIWMEPPHGRWHNVLTGEQIDIAGPIPVSALYGNLPFAVLRATSTEP